jgi:hypothetical protein
MKDAPRPPWPRLGLTLRTCVASILWKVVAEERKTRGFLLPEKVVKSSKSSMVVNELSYQLHTRAGVVGTTYSTHLAE